MAITIATIPDILINAEAPVLSIDMASIGSSHWLSSNRTQAVLCPLLPLAARNTLDIASLRV